ncbi:hypothetical protein [Corynebacterium deserti]|nr:hypothetical protein [Corynebacterium deserti]
MRYLGDAASISTNNPMCPVLVDAPYRHQWMLSQGGGVELHLDVL